MTRQHRNGFGFETLMNGARVRASTLAFGLAIMNAACTAQIGDAPGEQYTEQTTEDETDENQQPIRNGTVVQKAGVVALVDVNGKVFCTGALIAEQFMITAAHCVTPLLGSGVKNGVVRATIRYYDPRLSVGTWRNVSSTMQQFAASVHPNYTGNGDWNDDIAVLQRSSKWLSTFPSDYLRLSVGSCAQIDRHDRYGAGAKGFSGANDGKLRTMPINVHGCNTNAFYDLVGSRQICRGDSGGPGIRRAGNVDLLVGLNTGITGSGNDCGESGDEQWSVRMNTSKVNWIESTMSGVSCTAHTASDGHPFRICYFVPPVF